MTTIGTYVVLSTAHLTMAVSEQLDEMGPDRERRQRFGDWRDDVKVRCDFAYGHWVRVSYADPDDQHYDLEAEFAKMPDCLADCMRHASLFGAKWILFDRDEEAIEQIKTHDW